MQIRYLGHACFEIQEGKITIITDPYDETVTGLKLKDPTADVVTVSHADPESNNPKGVKGDPRILDWPGEYEAFGIHMRGIHSFHSPKDAEDQKENTIFTIKWNGIRLCHLGDQGCKLTDQQLEKIGDVDVLFVPVGGRTTIDAKKAHAVIEQIDPRVIIPMQYASPKSKIELDPLETFLGLVGAKDVQPLPEFKFKKSDLPEDNSKVVVLSVT